MGERVFPPHPVRLSRYSYLIALLPDELIRRLGIAIPLASRGVSSYTPVVLTWRSHSGLASRFLYQAG